MPLPWYNPKAWSPVVVSVDDLDQQISANMVAIARGGEPGGRLTLESGVPVSTSDQLAKTAIVYTPDLHDIVPLYDNVNNRTFPMNFAETSASLSGLTADRPYDVFGYNNAGTFALELVAWTNGTTRATALARTDGSGNFWVKSGDSSRRYLGTICITGTTGQCEDSLAKRFVWNLYNQVPRRLRRLETTDTWTYTTDTFRQANNSAANQVEIVVGIQSAHLHLLLRAHSDNSSLEVQRYAAIGEDSTSTPLAGQLIEYVRPNSVRVVGQIAVLDHKPAIGKHIYAMLEASVATGTTTWYGDGGVPTKLQSGLSGTIIG